MKKLITTLVVAVCGMALAFAADTLDPKAQEKATVVSGNARFTVLTDRLIRMEWAEDGKFEDNATLAIINRNLPVPSFTKSEKDGTLTIKTKKVVLTYKGGAFSADNLKVSFSMNGRNVVWTPGADDKGNLLGTTRTLDGCGGFNLISKREKELEKGILSKDGWAVIDESVRHILVKNDSDWGEWVACRPEGNRQDLYIFAYGHDYKAALGDFIKVAGRIPLPPKYTLGYWWSRYWAYTDDEMLAIGKELKDRGVPLDVFIIDMDWHHTFKPMAKRVGFDEFGQRQGWTGYTWNPNLIRNPEGFLYDLHKMGYKTALNLHPASGIRPIESCYHDFVKDYLSRTSDYDGPKDYVYKEGGYLYVGNEKPVGKEGYSAAVPFRLSQREWADAYFNSVIHPLEKQGVDFWWLDWQQWRESRYCKDLSNTFWCNYTFFNDKVRQSKSKGLDADRPFIYHRWGGLGSHRYQIGFSGDTQCEWSVLGFLPYFTATASNVGYGYWGHDIGGHMHIRGRERLTEPEMYTRWLQYGVFTPIFKTHSTASANLERKIWAFPTHYEYMKEAIRLRYSLTPYIYDAARQAFDTGVSMTRPMYYEYPEDERAYTWHQEFFFGDNILAIVIDSPLGEDGYAERKVWFPAGNDWYDMAHHKMVKGGCEKTLKYAINENPWFVRAGAIIPLADENLVNLQQESNVLRILVVPGSGKSCYTHYEDDGLTQNYVNDFATTRIDKTASSKKVELCVAPREGSFKGALPTRKLSFIFEGHTAAPVSATVNGQAAQARVEGSAVTVEAPELPCSEPVKVIVIF